MEPSVSLAVRHKPQLWCKLESSVMFALASWAIPGAHPRSSRMFPFFNLWMHSLSIKSRRTLSSWFSTKENPITYIYIYIGHGKYVSIPSSYTYTYLNTLVRTNGQASKQTNEHAVPCRERERERRVRSQLIIPRSLKSKTPIDRTSVQARSTSSNFDRGLGFRKHLFTAFKVPWIETSPNFPVLRIAMNSYIAIMN